jgi:hypothetical protein
MRTILIPVLHALAAAVRSRAALQLEILALRQQLALLHHNGPKRPHLRPVDRFFWAWKSRRVKIGRPTVPKDIRDLIRKISVANPLWGAPRVHGELLKLGITVSQPTVGKYMVRHRKPPSQTWRTCLANHLHNLVSVDFFTVPTVTFRVFFVFIVLAHDRRRVIHFNVTEQPQPRGQHSRSSRRFPGTRHPVTSSVIVTASMVVTSFNG